MPEPDAPLPPEVISLLQQGRPLEAIKALRAARRVGLAQAKQAIDAHRRGSVATVVTSPSSAPDPTALPEAVVRSLREGRKIDAIRELREASGIGLKEAYDRI